MYSSIKTLNRKVGRKLRIVGQVIRLLLAYGCGVMGGLSVAVWRYGIGDTDAIIVSGCILVSLIALGALIEE